MKIAIVNRETLEIASTYEDVAPNQAKYGGPWGNPAFTSHIAIPADMDPRAVTFELDGTSVVAIEDEDLAAELLYKDQVAAVSRAIGNAMAFGQTLVTEFAAENVMLGITQDGKTGEVLDKMAPVMAAVQSGSLYEAITRAKAITDFDAKYVTHDRLYAFINKIEAYLGIQLSL